MMASVSSPELLLSNLVRSALEVRGAMGLLDSPSLSERFTVVLRRLFVADLLSQEWIIAIGGTQGAGKTTLARLMYDLEAGSLDGEWLPANEGRGECMPVLLVEEDGRAAPQGYVRRVLPSPGADTAAREGGSFIIVEQPVSPAEFRSAATGRSSDCLLPVLRLPRRYLELPGQAFLLLPGYEPRHDGNGDWQDLMRQALVGAAACIVVTDQTRLANADQRQILKDMHAKQLAGTLPVVVITKTEGALGDHSRQTELRQTAGELFDVAVELQDRFVLCTSTDADHLALWRPQLAAALSEVTTASGQARQRQLAHLDSLLRGELTEVIADIRERFTVQAGVDDVHGKDVLDAYMETFDAAAEHLKAQYEDRLVGVLEDRLREASKHLQATLITEFEGAWNRVINVCNTAGEERRRMAKAVEMAWTNPGAVALRNIQVLGELTAARLGGPSPTTPAPGPAAGAVSRLGYTAADGTELAWTEPSAETLANLAVVFYPYRDDQGRAGKVSKDLQASIKLLPALTLEFARVASLFPEHLGLDPVTLAPVDAPGAFRRVQEDFTAMGVSKNQVIKGIAIMLAIDGAADGKIDTIPALLSALGLGGSGTAAGGAAAAAASVVTGFVAAGLLALCVLQEINRQDIKLAIAAENALNRIKDQHLTHYRKWFDAMMAHVRDTLRDRLSVRYRLDEQLMRRDRLAKALADLRSLKLDLQEQLGSHSGILAPVAPTVTG